MNLIEIRPQGPRSLWVVAFGLKAWGASVDASDAYFGGTSAAISMYGADGNQSGYFSRCEAHRVVKVSGDGVDDMSVTIRHSRVSDFTNSIDLVPGTGSVRVAGTELDGGPVTGPVECVAVWDEGTNLYPNTCP